MVGFLKYEFNNKLLSGVLFFKVKSGVIWIRSNKKVKSINYLKPQ